MPKKIRKLKKPWGYELLFAHTQHYAGKILVIDEGEELSLQYHQKKEESIYVSEGKVEITLKNKKMILKVGDTLHIPPKTKHRMKALKNTRVFEVSTPELEDVVRLEDRYGRI